MFANVLKKFFTGRTQYENKTATATPERIAAMIDDVRNALSRNPATLARDFAGAGALVVILLVGLSLPGLS